MSQKPFVQLELFENDVAPVDEKNAAGMVSEALQAGQTVGILRSCSGLELLVADPVRTKGESRLFRYGLVLGDRCGFSKRAAELLVKGACLEGRRLWARPAGHPWLGWAEWGVLTGAVP